MSSKKCLSLVAITHLLPTLNWCWWLLLLAWGGSLPACPLPELGQTSPSKGQSPEVTTTQLAQHVMQLANTTRVQGYRTGLRQLADQQLLSSMTQQLLARIPKTTPTEIKLPLHQLDQSAVTCLLPLTTERQALWFAQLGIRGMQRRLIAHVGLGRRYWNHQQLWGYNLFLDRDVRWRHLRGGVGLEAGCHGLTLSANYYTGITGWKASRVMAGQDEQPATGGDLRLQGRLERYPQWTGELLYEYYRGEKVLLTAGRPWQKNPDQLTASLHYTPIPLLTLGVDYQYGLQRHRQFAYKLLLTYSVGLPWREQMTRCTRLHRSVDFMTKHPYLFVNRRYDMVFNYRQQPTITLVLPAIISGEAGQQIPLSPQITSNYPFSHIEWQHSTFTNAGGQIDQQGSSSYRIQLPPWQATGSNRYGVRAVAYDSCGHASQPAECTIIVHPAELDLTRSTTTIKPSTLIANGKEHATLVVTARSKRNQPLRHISALQWQLAITGVGSHSDIVVDAFKELPQQPGVYATTLRATTAGSAQLTPLCAGQRLPPVTLTLSPCPTGRSVPDTKYPEEKQAECVQRATATTEPLERRDKPQNATPLFDNQQCELQLDPITQWQSGWQTTVQLTLRDHQQQPVTGRAQQIIPTFTPDILRDYASLTHFHPQIGAFQESAPGVYRATISSRHEGSAWLQLTIANQRLPKIVSLAMISKLNITLTPPPYLYGKKLMSTGNRHPLAIEVLSGSGTPPANYKKIKVEVTASDSRVKISGSPASLNAQGQGQVTVESSVPISSVQLVGKFSRGDQAITGETTVSFDTPFCIDKITGPDNLPGLTPSSVAQLNTAWAGARFTLHTSGLPGKEWGVSNPAALTIIERGPHHVTFEFRQQPLDGIALIGISEGYEVIRETLFITHWLTNPSGSGP